MSSHHTVRENQEFALIIADGESCTERLMQELLDWNPLVVVLDGAYERVAALGYKVDVWLGDFDRTPRMDLVAAQDHVEVVHRPRQDSTDLEKGISYCIGRGFSTVNILWATGRRMDHTLANLTNLVKFRQQAQVTIHDDYSTVFPLPNKFTKWYKAGTAISLLPVGEATGISTKNLVWPLKEEPLRLGERIGSSNRVAKDGLVEITYAGGHLLMMECWD